MASSYNIKNESICRTCMGKEDLLSMFDISYDTMTLDLVISAITGVKIGQDDGLPTTVCLICKEKAITAFEFKRKSQDVDVTLRGILKKEKEDLELDHSTYENCEQIKRELSTADDHLDCQDGWALDDLEDMAIVKNEDECRDSGHQCKNCTAVFESYKKYQEHLRKKCVKVEIDDANNNYCPLCGTFYYDAVNLTKHMWDCHTDLMGPKKRGRPKKLMTGAILSKLTENGFHLKSVQDKKYCCTFCDEEFKTKEDAHIHQMEHKDSKLLFCLFCKKSYLKKKYFDSHVCIETKNSEDNNKQVNEDENSKQDFLSEITLQELLDPYDAEENNRVVQVCPVCTGVFRSEEELADHNDNEHPELSLRCNLCSKIFATVKSASRHRNICKQVERKFRCSTCGLKFAYELSLNKHILRYHEGQSVSVAFIDTKSKESRQYKCDNCSKVFGRKEALIKHSKIHSDKLYECDVCKKKFNRSDNLRSHKRTHEPRTKMTTCLCLYCGRSFNNSSNLIVHMRRHTGEKPYKCDYCGKGFPRSSDLQCHRRSHTGEKPCICGVCGKGFSRSNKLSRHMRVHTGVKPYKCTFCEKAFSQSNDLTLHVRRHTGDKPYICEICGERFIQGTALHNHRRTHGHFPPTSSDSQLHTITYTVQCINPQE